MGTRGSRAPHADTVEHRTQVNESSALPTRGCAVQGATPHPHTLRPARSACAWWAPRAASCRRGEGVTSQHLGETCWSRRAPRACVTEWPSCVWGAPRSCAKGAERLFDFVVVSSGDGNLPRQDCHLAGDAPSEFRVQSLLEPGDAPSWAPRTTLWKTDIRSKPLWRRRTACSRSRDLTTNTV